MDLAKLYTRAVFRVSEHRSGKREPCAYDTKRVALGPGHILRGLRRYFWTIPESGAVRL